MKDPYNWRFWLSFALFARIVIAVIELYTTKVPRVIPGVWGFWDGDTKEYLLPIDNLIKYGHYNPDFRMPGYGVFYFPLVLLFSKTVAYNILIVFQLVCAALSSYLLALTALQLFKKKAFFYITFFIYATTIYSFYAELFLLTDSLATSFLVMSAFCFVSYFKNQKSSRLIYSGAFLTGVIFLRPVYCLLLIFFAIILFVNLIRQKHKVIVPVLCFISVFAVCDGSWMFRNYLHYKRIFPLTREVFYTIDNVSYLTRLMDFGSAYGGRIEWWDPRTGPYWLMNNDTIAFDMQDTVFVLSKDTIYNGKKIPKERGIPLPPDMYTSKFNLDSLIILKKQIVQYRRIVNLPEMGQRQLLNTIDNKIEIYAQSIRDEKPLSYQIKVRWNLLKEFLDEITYEIPYIRYTYRIYHAFIILVLIFGGFGIMVMMGGALKLPVRLLIPLIPLYGIIIHPLVFRVTVGRYFDPTFPFLLVCAIYTVVWLKEKFIAKKQ